MKRFYEQQQRDADDAEAARRAAAQAKREEAAALDRLRKQLWRCTVCTKANAGDVATCVTCGREKGYVPFRALPLHPQYKKFPAAFKLEYKQTEAMLGAGVDPNAADGQGWTALHWAAALGREDIARLLLAHRANIEVRRLDGWRPLHLAADCGHEHVVAALLELGADPDAETGAERLTALHLAARKGFTRIVAELLDTPEESGTMMRFFRDGDGTLKPGLRGGKVALAGEYVPSAEAQAAAGSAAGFGRRRASVGPRSAEIGWTPLHWASSMGHLEVVQLLINHGAGLHTKDADGWLPYQLASLRGHPKVVELLHNLGGAPPAHMLTAVNTASYLRNVVRERVKQRGFVESMHERARREELKAERAKAAAAAQDDDARASTKLPQIRR